MPDSRKAIYWDSNCWLSYINAIPDRLSVLDALLDASSTESGGIRLYTFALSKVEVAFSATEQNKKALDRETEQRIESLWGDPDAVVLVEFHDGIANSARDLIRGAITQGRSLKPLDAIHLATAKWLSDRGNLVDEFHTYDSQLLKWSQTLDFNGIRPYAPQPRMF